MALPDLSISDLDSFNGVTLQKRQLAGNYFFYSERAVPHEHPHHIAIGTTDGSPSNGLDLRSTGRDTGALAIRKMALRDQTIIPHFDKTELAVTRTQESTSLRRC
jgi:hypothetical protein